MILHSCGVIYCVVARNMTPVDMEKLDEQLDLVLCSAWAESTLKTRNSQWKRYLDFCFSNNLVPMPGDVLTVARFLIHLSLTCKYSTWAALTLSFHSLLRKSNIVQNNYKELDMVLLRSDVEFDSSGIILNVRKTKTIQAKEYVLKIPIIYIQVAKGCVLLACWVRTC